MLILSNLVGKARGFAARLYFRWVDMSTFHLDDDATRVTNLCMRWFQRDYELLSDETVAAVVRCFRVTNALIERWPLAVGTIIEKNSHIFDGSFETWARSGDLLKGVDAVPTWSEMLSFIIHYWTFDSYMLERMGLFLNADMNNIIYNIHHRRKHGNIQQRTYEGVRKLLILAVTDAEPSVRSNPILWWISILVTQRQRFHKQPVSLLGAKFKRTVPRLAFEDNLWSLIHYSRMLVMGLAIEKWIADNDRVLFGGRASATTHQKMHLINKAQCLATVDEEKEETDEEPELLEEGIIVTSDSQTSVGHHQTPADTRSMDGSIAPGSALLLLLDRTWKRSSMHNGFQGLGYQYEVMLEVYERAFSRHKDGELYLDGPTNSTRNSCGIWKTAEKANEAARLAVTRRFGKKENAKVWKEVLQKDGTTKINGVFVNRTGNVKVRASVVKKEQNWSDEMWMIL